MLAGQINHTHDCNAARRSEQAPANAARTADL